MINKLEAQVLKFQISSGTPSKGKTYEAMLETADKRIMEIKAKNFKDALSQSYEFLLRTANPLRPLKVQATEDFEGQEQADIISKFTLYSELKNVHVSYYFR